MLESFSVFKAIYLLLFIYNDIDIDIEICSILLEKIEKNIMFLFNIINEIIIINRNILDFIH